MTHREAQRDIHCIVLSLIIDIQVRSECYKFYFFKINSNQKRVNYSVLKTIRYRPRTLCTTLYCIPCTALYTQVTVHTDTVWRRSAVGT